MGLPYTPGAILSLQMTTRPVYPAMADRQRRQPWPIGRRLKHMRSRSRGAPPRRPRRIVPASPTHGPHAACPVSGTVRASVRSTSTRGASGDRVEIRLFLSPARGVVSFSSGVQRSSTLAAGVSAVSPATASGTPRGQRVGEPMHQRCHSRGPVHRRPPPGSSAGFPEAFPEPAQPAMSGNVACSCMLSGLR